MKRLYKKLIAWTYKEPVFLNISDQAQFAKINEELAELRKQPDDVTEYVDVVMCIFILADRNGISYNQLKKAFSKKLEININRKWYKNAAGINQHIR